MAHVCMLRLIGWLVVCSVATQVSWAGLIAVPSTDAYTFHVFADGGTRLYIDGKLVIDSWTVSVAEPSTAPIILTAGQFYDIKLEYTDDIGNATVRACASSCSPFLLPNCALLLYSPHACAHAHPDRKSVV